MSSVTWFLLLGGLLMALGGWVAFLLALRSGQFKDIEAVKHQMFEEGR
ncbi:MAG: cbb3-type cytochrome oxidase assembly protein CcoS [Planctomycetia bacterium]|nr:cbb3-type cytochrome oxidase assembly protein CcoS [Planctomycetia bacterium]